MTQIQCETEHFKGRIIFISMYNDIVWCERGNTEKCDENSLAVANFVRRFPHGHWSFLRPGSEKKWYGTCSDEPDGDWDKIVERMMINFVKKSHPVFRATWKKENCEVKGKKRSIHFHELIFFVNQVSIYGAVANICAENYPTRQKL